MHHTREQAAEILEHLRGHVGAERAIAAPDIARRLGRKKSFARTVRDIIAARRSEWARRLDTHVCATPCGGYYIAASVEEIHAYQSHLAALAATATTKSQAVAADSAAAGIH